MSHKDRQWLTRIVAVALLLFAVAAVAVSFRVGQTRAAPSASPPVIAQVLDADCASADISGFAFSKVTDIDTFTVQSADSLIELQFNGRLDADTITGGLGVVFELRVDDVASSYGRARATIHVEDLPQYGQLASITAFYDGLTPGAHTVSLWARTGSGGSTTGAIVDSGCWASDHVAIKEYLPFGSVAIPAVLRD
jgi:hypothetical protein